MEERKIEGKLSTEEYGFVIAPGAFKAQDDVPLTMGVGGRVIGKCKINPDGTFTATLFEPDDGET